MVPLVDKLGMEGLSWLASGGALYTAGIVFYLNDRRWRHAHGIWHLFVMGGSANHFVTVLYFVNLTLIYLIVDSPPQGLTWPRRTFVSTRFF